MRLSAPQPDRCTADDFKKLFASCTDQLQGLSYTLTGDPHRARVSFDHALQESLESANLVFREWMMQWARRLIVKACIAEMDSEIKRTARKLSLGINKGTLPRSGAFDFLPTNTPELFQEQLLTLDAVSRFVVVLRVLEGYSRRETALLLGIDEAICDAAHELANFLSFRRDSPGMESKAVTV